jgi:hypothetical protein
MIIVVMAFFMNEFGEIYLNNGSLMLILGVFTG